MAADRGSRVNGICPSRRHYLNERKLINWVIGFWWKCARLIPHYPPGPRPQACTGLVSSPIFILIGAGLVMLLATADIPSALLLRASTPSTYSSPSRCVQHRSTVSWISPMLHFPSSRLLLSSAILLLAACGSDDGSPSEPPVPTAFAEVDDAARAAYATHQVPMGLAVFDHEGNKVFERMYGDFSADRRVPIASASKLVSGVTIFRLIDAGYLSLDSTTGGLLGWTGTKGEITLRHLLSFTSGLEPEHPCTYQPEIALADCVEQIRQPELLGPPGSRSRRRSPLVAPRRVLSRPHGAS
jgi:CubicO group peptidase (beta-lactamase class C family)